MALKKEAAVSDCGKFVNYIDGFHSTQKFTLPSSSALSYSIAEITANKTVIEENAAEEPL